MNTEKEISTISAFDSVEADLRFLGNLNFALRSNGFDRINERSWRNESENIRVVVIENNYEDLGEVLFDTVKIFSDSVEKTMEFPITSGPFIIKNYVEHLDVISEWILSNVIELMSNIREESVSSNSDRDIISEILGNLFNSSGKRLGEYNKKEVDKLISFLSKKNPGLIRRMQDDVRKAKKINYEKASSEGVLRDKNHELTKIANDLDKLENILIAVHDKIAFGENIDLINNMRNDLLGESSNFLPELEFMRRLRGNDYMLDIGISLEDLAYAFKDSIENTRTYLDTFVKNGYLRIEKTDNGEVYKRVVVLDVDDDHDTGSVDFPKKEMKILPDRSILKIMNKLGIGGNSKRRKVK